MSGTLRFVAGSKARLTGVGMVVALVVGVAGAIAYFTSTGAGTATAQAGSLTAATISAPSSAYNSVAITWGEQASLTDSSLSRSIGYTVERRGSGGSFAAIPSGPCAGSLPHGTSVCTDTPSASDTYTYRVVARFNSWTSTSNEVSVAATADTTPPTSLVGFPSGGSYNERGWNGGCSLPGGGVCGTANDGGFGATGVRRVEVSIRRGSDGAYWDGGAWVSGSRWQLATGTTSWSYQLAGTALVDGAAYTVQSRATDNAGNVQSPVATVGFTYDTTAPSATIAFPGAGGVYNGSGWTGAIAGTAADSGSGVASVAVAIQDGSGNWYDGTGFGSATIVYLTAGGTTSWSYGIPAGKLADGHTYTVEVEARDNAATPNTGAATGTFRYDTRAPAATIGFPSAGSSYNASGWTGSISGTTDDHGGAGVASVGVAIRDGGGNYYDGTGFTSPTIVYNPAAGTTSWSYALAAGTLVDGHTYRVTVRASDGTTTPNSDPNAATTSFGYDTSAPTATIAFPTAAYYSADGWSGVIGGTAADGNGSGVAAVGVAIQDGTGNYYDGSGFVSRAAVYNAATTSDGWAHWSYPIAAGKLTNGHSYRVVVQTSDRTITVNTNANAATAGFGYDTSPPTAAVGFPSAAFTNAGGWTGAITGTASDNLSGVASVRIAIRDGSGNYYDGNGFASGSIAYLTAAGTTSWSYPLPVGKLTDGHTYHVTVATTDNAVTANGDTSAATASFSYDTSPPSATVGFPSAGTFYNETGWTGSISGTASDHGGSGVASVQVSVKDTTTGACADATGAFTVGSCTTSFVLATGTTGWAFALAAANLTDGHAYTVTVRTADALGNTDSSAATAAWTYDVSAPTAAIAFPVAGTAYNAAGWDAAGAITGTALDSGSGVGTVKVAVQDGSGNYYDGSGFTSATIVYNAATTSDAWAHWRYAIAAAKLTDGHTYRITVQTVDRTTTPNTAPSAATGSVDYDTAPPTSAALTTSGSFTSATWPGEVRGTASDVGAGGHGIGSVKLSIQDSVSGKCWNGTDFTTAACPNYVAVTAGGTADGTASAGWSYTLDASALTIGHTYTVQVQAVDATDRGNTSGSLAAGSFSYAAASVGYSATGSATVYTSSGTQGVGYPSGTNANDLLLLVMVNNTNQTNDGPTTGGWTQLANASSTKPNQFRLSVWWKLAASGETSVPVQFHTSGTGAAAWIVRYVRPGGYPPIPTSATAGVSAGATASPTAQSTLTPTPDVTTNAANATVISFVAVRAANTLSLGTAGTFALAGTATSSVPCAFGVADTLVAASGSTPASPTWSQSGTPAQWAWATVAFR